MNKKKILIIILLVIIITIMTVFASCAKIQTENSTINIVGTHPGVSIVFGNFDIVSRKNSNGLTIFEVLPEDADEFKQLTFGSEYCVGEFTLHECYKYDTVFAEGFNIGDICKLFFDGEEYWLGRQVNGKYFYFQSIPFVSPIVENENAVRAIGFLPSVIFSADMEGKEPGIPRKVLYDWEELKIFFPESKYDDVLKKIYARCYDFLNSVEGVVEISYDEENSAITVSNNWEAAK